MKKRYWFGVLFLLVVAPYVMAQACIEIDPFNLTEVRSETHLCPGREYVTPGVKIDRDNVLLDCGLSKLVSGGSIGILIMNATNVTVANCTIRFFETGILLNAPGRIIFKNVTVRDNVFGVLMFMDPKKSYPNIYWNMRFMKNNVSFSRMWLGDSFGGGYFGQMELYLGTIDRQSITISRDLKIPGTIETTPAPNQIATVPAVQNEKRPILKDRKYFGLIVLAVVLVGLYFVWNRRARPITSW